MGFGGPNDVEWLKSTASYGEDVSIDRLPISNRTIPFSHKNSTSPKIGPTEINLWLSSFARH